MTLQSWLPTYQILAEKALKDFFDTRYTESVWVESDFEAALRYAVEWGWKRLRPILAMITYEYIAQKDVWYWITESGKGLLSSIIGIELMHCYTLVHDDLPSMDNDEIRRGKPTVWKAFWEPMALLVGDALQTMSFELLANTGKSRVISELARSLWDRGVVRWQVRDTFLRHDTLSLEELLRIHDEKTWDFIAACLVIGAILGDAPESDIVQFRQFGMWLGRAFQIQDDILDVTGTVAQVWKNTGKDSNLWKWIVSLVWLYSAKEIIADIEQKLKKDIEKCSDIRFWEIIDYVIHRNY